jgi:hypothetical protein
MPFEKVHTIRDIPDRMRCVIGIKEIGLVEPGQIDVGLDSPFDSE